MGYTVDGEHGTGAEEVRVMSTRQTTAVLEVAGVHWATEKAVMALLGGSPLTIIRYRALTIPVRSDPHLQWIRSG